MPATNGGDGGESHGPSELCVCGDTYARHGTGNDGGPCQVYTREVRRGVPQFVPCDCDQFTKSEDDS